MNEERNKNLYLMQAMIWNQNYPKSKPVCHSLGNDFQFTNTHESTHTRARTHTHTHVGRDSVVSIAIRYGLEGPAIESR